MLGPSLETIHCRNGSRVLVSAPLITSLRDKGGPLVAKDAVWSGWREADGFWRPGSVHPDLKGWETPPFGEATQAPASREVRSRSLVEKAKQKKTKQTGKKGNQEDATCLQKIKLSLQFGPGVLWRGNVFSCDSCVNLPTSFLC